MKRPLLLLLLFAGCAPRTVTREVFVRLPQPPPSVAVSTDTLFVRTPPDSVFVPREVLVPGAERVVVRRDTVTRTVPRIVTRYETPRGGAALLVHGLWLTSDSLRISGWDRDWTFLAPVPGEALLVEARGASDLVAAVSGTPRRPPAVRASVECPEPPDPLIRRTLWGWLQLGAWICAGACLGCVAALVVRR